MLKQQSIKSPVKIEGVNIFNGRKNSVVLHPAEENSGLVFIVNNQAIPVKLEYAENMGKRGVNNAIGLRCENNAVHLVEHLLSAIYALGIDNLRIELSDDVVPTTDNCALEFFNALKDEREQQLSRKLFWKYTGKDKRTIRSDNGKPDQIEILPADNFTIHYRACYPYASVGTQEFKFRPEEKKYGKEIASARSPAFLFNRQIANLFTKLGDLGFHGISNRNYLLIGSKRDPEYLNPSDYGVRFAGTEFVRHKILDALGTLALTGHQFTETEFRFNMTGHKFDLQALKQLFSENNFRLTYKT